MNAIIKNVEENLNSTQEFIFSLRKFFYKNPEIATKYEEFLQEKEGLVY